MPTAYDRVRYPGLPFAQTHPDRLAALGVLFGMEPAQVRRCRVLELGCGDGGNLIPMAFEFPNSEFLGLDLAQSGIDAGRAAIEALGLRNIRLEQLDILDAGAELGSFDFVIAHGVYSWAPEAVRDKVLAIAAGHLEPQGIAYVSYNALPGCRARLTYRDMLQYHGRGLTEPEAQLENAREFLRAVIEMEESRGPHGLYLQAAAQGLLNKPAAVLFHDEMGEVYHPVYFHEFAAHAARHGLQFLAEANYPDMRPREMPSNVAVFAERAAAGDRVARQQYFDYFRDRAFRQTLLCREAIAVPVEALPERVARFYVSSAAKPVSSDPDLKFGASEEFRGVHGGTLTAVHPVVKAAMLATIRRWPEALSFAELLGAAAELAGEPAEPEGVAGLLLGAYGSGLVEFHTTKPRCVSRVSDFPEVSALARWQAARGTMLTTPRHAGVEIAGEVERRLVTLVDGTRDVAGLTRAIAPLVDVDEESIAREVGVSLRKLAGIGLLVA